MRRCFCLAVLFGLFAALFSAVPARAEDLCEGDFRARLKCWTEGLDKRSVVVTLDQKLPFGELDIAWPARLDNLEVRVPAEETTGVGGTELLVLAGQRFVHPDARITRLSTQAVAELEGVKACTSKPGDLCDRLVGRGEPVSGRDLLDEPGFAPLLPRDEYSLDTDEGWAPDPRDWLLIGTATLLVLLLAAFVLAVRRAHPVAATGAQEPEPTTRLRTTPPRPRPRPGPSRPAIVRTDLHPQGYVELDRVLYRAVWAEPGPPPPPGSRVDVTDAPEPDSDVLYAFPPAAGRHAHAHAR